MLSALSARFINILVPGVNICIAPAAFDCTTSHNIIDVCTQVGTFSRFVRLS